MSEKHGFAYLHGFASSPLSRKGQALAQAFAERGRKMRTPDLNCPSFARLSYAAMLAAVDAMDANGGGTGLRWRLVGSSLGGWLAARWAALHPDRVDRLVLLCPGFELAARWPEMIGPEQMSTWERTGSLSLPDATGQPVAVHWGFIKEARQEPGTPEVPCPTLIIHGSRDEVVPIALSRAYAATRDHVRLVEVDDDHSLAASIPQITTAVLDLFDIPQTP